MNIARGLCIKPSPINDKGCFATIDFPRWKKIAEYTGERITNAEARRRAHRRKLRICEMDARWSIDGSKGGNGTHYINHSCSPNSFTRLQHGHLLFFALCDIRHGDEITLDYQNTLHSDKKRCCCKTPKCRGTINNLSG